MSSGPAPPRISTYRSPAFRAAGRPSRGAALALVFLHLPALVMLAAGVAANGLGTATVAVIVAVIVLVSIVVAVRRTEAFLTCSAACVVVGFAPFSRTRIRIGEISEVSLVTVDAFEEYGGWGIKGGPRAERGRLYSAGGSRAVRLGTHDRRTYLVAFTDPDEAERARRAVAGHLVRS